MCYSILFKLSFLSNAIISLWVIFSWLWFYLPCWRLEFSWGCLNKPWYRYPRRLTLLSSIYSALAWTPACLGCWAQKAFSSFSIFSKREMPAFLSLALFLCVTSATRLPWPLPWWRLLSPRTQSDVLDSPAVSISCDFHVHSSILCRSLCCLFHLLIKQSLFLKALKLDSSRPKWRTNWVCPSSIWVQSQMSTISPAWFWQSLCFWQSFDVSSHLIQLCISGKNTEKWGCDLSTWYQRGLDAHSFP